MATHPVVRLLLWAALAYFAWFGFVLVIGSVDLVYFFIGMAMLIGVGVGAFKLRRHRPTAE